MLRAREEAGLGLLGLLRHRWLILGITLLVWVLATVQSFGVAVPLGDNVLRMLLMFFLGACAHLFAERVPLHWALVVGAIAGAAAFVYLLLYAAAKLPRPVRLRVDLSYGVFMYHWPLQQVLVLTPVFGLPTWAFVVVSLVVTLPVALASWHLVEHPALRRKDWTPRWARRPGSRAERGAAGQRGLTAAGR